MKSIRFFALVFLALSATAIQAKAALFFDSYQLDKAMIYEDIEACPGGDCGTLVGQGDLTAVKVTEKADTVSFVADVSNYKCLVPEECTAPDFNSAITVVAMKGFSEAVASNSLGGALTFQPKNGKGAFGGTSSCYIFAWDPQHLSAANDFSKGAAVTCTYYVTGIKGITTIYYFSKK